MATFEDSLHLAKEKMLDNTLQPTIEQNTIVCQMKQRRLQMTPVVISGRFFASSRHRRRGGRRSGHLRLRRALATGRRPDIFNTDQGSQFTPEAFTGLLTQYGAAISMDGDGRAFDNIMVERLWRTVKVEDVYIRDSKNPAEARFGLRRYFEHYNRRRRHQSLGRKTPAVVYGLAKGSDIARIMKTDGDRAKSRLTVNLCETVPP